MNQLPQIIFSPEAHKHLWIAKILPPFDLNTFFTAINGVAYIGCPAGLRRSELPDLRKQGVSFDKKVLFARGGKGEKNRATLLSGLLVIVLRYIQTFLGHDSSKTTEVYTDVTNVNFEKFKNPLDDLFTEYG